MGIHTHTLFVIGGDIPKEKEQQMDVRSDRADESEKRLQRNDGCKQTTTTMNKSPNDEIPRAEGVVPQSVSHRPDDSHTHYYSRNLSQVPAMIVIQ